MPRVNKGTLEKLNDFINSLPYEARSKCALCNETLTHIVKQAEAQTGAGTATVTRALADRINDEAVDGYKVGDQQLRRRVQRMDGPICPKRANNPTQNPESKPIQKWTCTECGGLYPMSIEKCLCQYEDRWLKENIDHIIGLIESMPYNKKDYLSGIERIKSALYKKVKQINEFLSSPTCFFSTTEKEK